MAQQKYCSQCGTPHALSANFCRECGAPFSAPPPSPPVYTAPTPAYDPYYEPLPVSNLLTIRLEQPGYFLEARVNGSHPMVCDAMGTIVAQLPGGIYYLDLRSEANSVHLEINMNHPTTIWVSFDPYYGGIIAREV